MYIGYEYCIVEYHTKEWEDLVSLGWTTQYEVSDENDKAKNKVIVRMIKRKDNVPMYVS
ncbi:MAG: hypothetical protein AABY32_01720 [Nanoarchaeota archaeon]